MVSVSELVQQLGFAILGVCAMYKNEGHRSINWYST